MHILRITPSIANEWNVRCIGDVVPALADRMFAPGFLHVTPETLQEILDDCRFMLDPDGPDLLPDERRAYRALVKQCERALAIGQAELPA
jgi:hypothetical protein